MMRKSICLTALLFTLACSVFAQKKLITGKVVDATTNEPLAGVSIVSDKKKSTTTKTDGTYSIEVDTTTSALFFSHINYGMQTIQLAGQTTIDLRMQAAAEKTLEDVVVIGYGTQRKSHLTGAISKFKNEKLDEAPVPRLDNALQGKIAGVQVLNLSSESGAEPKIRVRGQNSINAQPNPLIVVDGHILPPELSSMSYVNPADVESIEVLKDAASSAIYGSRGANGVIMITTKSGKAEKPKYSFKASAGAKTAYETYPMMSMTEYGNLLFYEASLKAKDPSIPPLTTNQIMAANERAAYVVEQTLMGGHPTDWQEEALRNATQNNIQMNISGGSRTARYYISGAYAKDEGLMYHSNFDRYTLRTKLDLQLSNRVKFGFNLNPSYIKRERPSVNFIDFVRFYSFLPVYHNETTAAFVGQVAQWANVKAGDFAQARHFNGRVYSGTMPDGSQWVTTTPSDPFSTANNTPKSIMETRTINSNDYRLQSGADLTFSITPGLDYKGTVSVFTGYYSTVDFAKRNSSKDGDLNRGQYTNRLVVDLLTEHTLTYIKKVNDHSFTVLGGFSAQKTKTKDDQTVGLDFPSDNITTLNTALQIDKASTYTFKSQLGLLSYLARLQYGYRNKYLLSASFRTDGSSKFGPDHKWGRFPAASIGWVISEEKFMDKATWLNHLKIRTSYGTTGNNNISDFAWIDLLYAANYPFGSGTGSANAGQVTSPTQLANPSITWERTFMFNAGVDLSIFKNAISLSVDAYQSKSDQLLLSQSTMGFTGATTTYNNIGRLQNRGIEVELTTNNIRNKDFIWSTSANFAHNKNKLLELGGEAFFLSQGERTELYRTMPGSPLIEYFGYQTDGVWLSQAQIDTAKAHGLVSNLSNLFTPGGLKLVDLDGNDTIDVRDRTVMGSPYPDFTWGITNNVTYRAFDLSFTFQGSQGGTLVNGDPNYNETKRINRNYNSNRWLSPMFPGDGKTPYSTNGFNWMLTDYVIEDASYFTLREIIIGYTLPAKFSKSLRMSSARFYFTAQNLYYHMGSNYRGINPEARYTGGPYSGSLYDGYQRGSYPLPKSYLFGVDINF